MYGPIHIKFDASCCTALQSYFVPVDILYYFNKLDKTWDIAVGVMIGLQDDQMRSWGLIAGRGNRYSLSPDHPDGL